MRNFESTNVSYVPKPNLADRLSQITTIHKNPNFQSKSYDNFQSQSQLSTKPWLPSNQSLEERPMSILSTDRIIYPSSNNYSKHKNIRSIKTNPSQCIKIAKILFLITLVSLTLSGIAMSTYTLVVINTKTTTTTTTTSTTSTSTTTTTTTTTTAVLPTECYAYTTVNDASRLAGSVGGLGSDAVAFGVVFNWIRFLGIGGTEIPTSPPAYSRCGAVYPGWYAGTLPTHGNTHVGTVCYVYLTYICYFANNILVTNCGTYYVYGLVNTVAGGRYCTV